MTISGRYSYKRALKLTPDRMRQLEELLNRYFDKIVYNCNIKNGSDITFQSLEEMLEYDNFSTGKIVSMNIYGETTAQLTINFSEGYGTFSNYEQVVYCNYTLYDVVQDTIFIKELNEFFKKSTLNYWLIGKATLFSLSLACYSFILIFRIIEARLRFSAANLSLDELLLAIALLFLAYFIDKNLLKKLFPPIVFYWGEEERAFDKKDKLRTNLFWVVLVGILIGIVVFFFTNLLK